MEENDFIISMDESNNPIVFSKKAIKYITIAANGDFSNIYLDDHKKITVHEDVWNLYKKIHN